MLQHANRQLLGVLLRDRLRDPRDFEIYVGLEAVVDTSGGLVWARVEKLLLELLADRPHLASPGGVPDTGSTAPR